MLRGAIVGFGKIARTNHLRAFYDIRLNDKVIITSAVEIDDNIRETIKKEYTGINFYKTQDELFEKEKLDFRHPDGQVNMGGLDWLYWTQ